MIRIPNTPALQESMIGMPTADAAAIGAPARGLGALARGLYDMGENFQGVALRTQAVENARMESEARNKLATDYSNFQLEIQKEQDPAARLSKTQAFLTNAKQSLVTADMPPVVRDRLTLHADDFTSRASIQAGADAARLAEKRAELAAGNELEAAMQSGNAAEVHGVIDRIGATGYRMPEEITAMHRKADYHLEYRKAQGAISADPIEAERELDDPEYLAKHPTATLESHASLLRQAEQAANRKRSDFINDVIIAGEDPSEDDLRNMADYGMIDKATHARWLTKLRSREVAPVSDPAVYEETYSTIMGYNPATDPSGRGESQLRQHIGSLNLPDADVKALNGKLSDRVNAATSKEPKSVHEAEFAAKLRTEFSRGDFGKFRFPVDEDSNPATPPTFPVNQKEYDKAWNLRGQFADQWRTILSSMPTNAGFDEVNKAYESLKKSYKDKKPVPDVSFSPVVAPPFDPAAVYAAAGGQPAEAGRTEFGGQVVRAPGVLYKDAKASVFGGKGDPEDNGKSAFGGKTGAGGKQGVAIPQALLEAKFPDKKPDWLQSNVRTVVRGPDGLFHVLPVVDLGTAESVWTKQGRPVLDLTEGAVKALGGRVLGQQAGVAGLDKLDFAVVSTDAGKPLKGLPWEDARTAWFRNNRLGSNDQVTLSLIALRDRWTQENQ